MLTALPPKTKTAIEDDRPIVIGRFPKPDYYVLAHEAKCRGDHTRAVTLLAMAARDLDVPMLICGDVLHDWDNHIAAVDRAWGKKQGRSVEPPEPAPTRIRAFKASGDDLFIDAVMAHKADRPVCASVLLRFVAEDLGVKFDRSGTWAEDWSRNFDAVHRAWLETCELNRGLSAL